MIRWRILVIGLFLTACSNAVPGCVNRAMNSTSSTGGGSGGGGGVAFDNLGYGNAGATPDFGLIASFGLRWTVIDLGNRLTPEATIAAVRAARAAGLKIQFIPYNANCEPQNLCLADPAGVVRDLAKGGTDGITVEVSETFDAQRTKDILDQWPGEKATTAGFATYPGALLNRHECNPDPNTWSLSFPSHMTDCTPALAENISLDQVTAIAYWAKINSGMRVIIYSLLTTTQENVLQAMRDAK